MKIFTKQLILILFVFAAFTASAQKTSTVTGKVIDATTKKPVDYASVLIRSTKDTTAVIGSAVTQPTGVFEIKDIPAGTYQLMTAFLGYKTTRKTITVVAGTPLNAGEMLLDPTGVNIETVDVVGATPPIRVKKDTLEFNASAFKVKENAVVEDVLKKLPGVEVDKAGGITAQGEKINRVRVDGKDFMGNDPLLATRNLPADMIDKIQIIDDLSDQSKFSGVDDGNREKIINITTRQDKKNGYFGNSTVAAGTDDRYEVNLNVNKFNQNQQFSV
ncbi:MAG: carboxypeptidase-like regulatory domain-containing protein, partial [Pedobacter sp.]